MANKIIDKLKETFNATPKTVRWVLLAVAFIVVLILLFLLVSKPKKVETPGLPKDKDVQLIITPEAANFLNTKIGEKSEQKFRIYATDNAIVDSVTVQTSLDGFSIKTACNDFHINKDIPCVVDAAFAPGNAHIRGDVALLVKWHDEGDSIDTNPKSQSIIIPVSAQAVVVIPEPVIPVQKTVPEPVSSFDGDEEEEPVIAGRPVFSQPEPAPRQKQEPKVEKCSDFAMPGYDMNGTQIGWIKPKNGRYEFHPFSDKECNKPTGTYNPDTGMITSNGKTIGTDSDHRNTSIDTSVLPKLKSKPTTVAPRTSEEKYKPSGMLNLKGSFANFTGAGMNLVPRKIDADALAGSATDDEAVYSSRPFDRTFILRQFKPIPATIVSDVRADPSVYGCDLDTGKCDGGSGIPVRATVDRNVYSDNGRTVIIPTGTLLMGYLTGELPGPYKSIGRMKIKWYQFIRPDGVEFNFDADQDPYSADSQGRVGVPGYGSTDYIEQMVMPLLTAIVPAAVNMIAPIADTFVNQIDLDNNTVVQSGTVRSSELAKNEVITAWNQVAQKLIVDALDNTVPPFSIAAGTRITVYSPVDLIATCGDGDQDGAQNAGKKCAFHEYGSKERRKWSDIQTKQQRELTVNNKDSSWTGQTRGFNLSKFCKTDSKGVFSVDDSKLQEIADSGYDYRTVLAYCQAYNYQAKNTLKQDVVYTNQQTTFQNTYGTKDDRTEEQQKAYNKEILGLQYAKDADGNETDVIVNPFNAPVEAAPEDPVGSLNCNGQAPDQYGCCPGETYEDMGESYIDENGSHFACCPAGDGDCFPPLQLN